MPTVEEIRAALRHVIDPEVGMNVVDLGLVYGIDIEPSRVHIDMTMTTPACPMSDMITTDARQSIGDIVPEGTEIAIDLVWDPPWGAEQMSEQAKRHFGWDENEI
ncbi:MAG TPA: metal-sulfur cluster assembly factor [Candidatus Desulfobacillus sp.]|nr:metal-sulfur cluster assembly factor [Candidatus Desulfobacillus sp.]